MNAVIYARYSSDSQREESIDGQLRECKEYADKHGLAIVGEYIDRAMSAKTDDRPEFQQMLRDSGKRLFEVVLVWKLDRFSRSREDSALNKMILKRNGVRVVSAKESISDGPEGIILEAMLEGMAEYYSAELAVKIKRGLKDNALKGIHNGGNLPYGYMVDENRRIQIDPLTAPIVLEIFTRYADGDTMTAIINDLNERGIRTRRGNKFNANSSMHNMLKNRRFIGEYTYQGIEVTDHPAIVPIEVFEKVQQRMERNRRAPAAKKAPAEYILTTKLFCGHCGKYMIGESGTSHTGTTYHYYKCGEAKRKRGRCDKKAVKKDWIERLVVQHTMQYVLQDDVIDKLAELIMELQQKESAALPLLRKQLKQTEKSIGNMLNAIEQGVFTSSTKQRLEELEERKAELEILIAKEQMQRTLLEKDQIVFWISQFKDGNIDDPEYRRRIVDIFVNSIFLYDDKLMLFFNYKDGTKTVTIEDIKGSDLEQSTPPETAK